MMNIWWSVRSRCWLWVGDALLDLNQGMWRMMNDGTRSQGLEWLSLYVLIMDRLDLLMHVYCMNVMIWVCSDVWIATKLWVRICRSVRGLSLVKACIHAGSALPSSVYTLIHDFWWYNWFWRMLQSSVFRSVFWWLLFVDRVSVIQYWVF